jgi:hypothetical protein
MDSEENTTAHLEHTREMIKIDSLKRIYDMNVLKEVAIQLQDFVMETGASKKIGDNEHLYVEAWQFAMMHLGLCFVIRKVTDTSKGENYSFEAEGELVHILTGRILGYASAEISRSENGRSKWERPALRSMVQTRAEGKAARMFLSVLASMAGFEATPAEEMFGAAIEAGGEDRRERKKPNREPASDEQLAVIAELLANALIPRNDEDRLKVNELIGSGKLADKQADFYIDKLSAKIAKALEAGSNY